MLIISALKDVEKGTGPVRVAVPDTLISVSMCRSTYTIDELLWGRLALGGLRKNRLWWQEPWPHTPSDEGLRVRSLAERRSGVRRLPETFP